jgi:hypothetical protein
MFGETEGQTFTLELDAADGAALTGVLDAAMQSGHPLVMVAARHLQEKVREAVLDAIPTDRALEQIDSVLADDDLPDEVRSDVEEIRQRISCRDSKPEPGLTDMSAFEAAMPDEEPGQ